MKKNLFWDMDYTLNRLYDEPNWLEDLRSFNPRPYINAKPSCDMKELKKLLTKAKAQGYNNIVISWLSKDSNAEYDRKVVKAKEEWLTRYGLSDILDGVEIVPYGTPKHEVCAKYGKGILFDDEEHNRNAWDLGETVDPTKNLLKSLELLLD